MDQRFLHGILGKVGVAKDQARERVQAVESVGHQQVEGVHVTASRALTSSIGLATSLVLLRARTKMTRSSCRRFNPRPLDSEV